MQKFLLFLSALVGALLTTVPAEATKPNVVFIFIDDQGYYDLGCYGATEIKTPAYMLRQFKPFGRSQVRKI